MKTIISVIHEYMSISLKQKSSHTFDEIFEQVEKQLSQQWAKDNSKDLDDIILNKKGETYKLLTIDGSFVRNDDGTFSLKKS